MKDVIFFFCVLKNLERMHEGQDAQRPSPALMSLHSVSPAWSRHNVMIRVTSLFEFFICYFPYAFWYFIERARVYVQSLRSDYTLQIDWCHCHNRRVFFKLKRKTHANCTILIIFLSRRACVVLYKQILSMGNVRQFRAAFFFFDTFIFLFFRSAQTLSRLHEPWVTQSWAHFYLCFYKK